MASLSFDDAARRYPDLAQQVLGKLAALLESAVDPRSVAWLTIVCHQDADQPLDEAACADLMASGSLPWRLGLSGRLAEHFSCACQGEARP